MLGGTYGKILHVNLNTNATWIETPPDDLYRLLVGGRALVAYFLLRDLPPNSDPLSPDLVVCGVVFLGCGFVVCWLCSSRGGGWGRVPA